MFHFDIDFQDKNGERHMLAIRAQALLGDLERCNCLIVVPEDNMGMAAGESVVCMRIDMAEGAEI